MAVVRSLDAWRALERATALSTLIHQRRLTPSCGGHYPTAERTVDPARNVVESLTSRAGIREEHRPIRDKHPQAWLPPNGLTSSLLGRAHQPPTPHPPPNL